MVTTALLCILGLLLPLFTRLATDSANVFVWLVDLASHWQWLYLAGLVAAALAASLQNWRWALLLIAAPLPWLTASPGTPRGTEAGDVITVASANVNLGSGNVENLSRWLASSGVDLIALHEVSPSYAKSLAGMTSYPFRVSYPERGPFGIALLSRLPIQHATLKHDQTGNPRVEAKVRWNGGLLNVVALHPMPPISAHYQQLRNRLLDEIGRTLASTAVPKAMRAQAHPLERPY